MINTNKLNTQLNHDLEYTCVQLLGLKNQQFHSHNNSYGKKIALRLRLHVKVILQNTTAT